MTSGEAHRSGAAVEIAGTSDRAALLALLAAQFEELEIPLEADRLAAAVDLRPNRAYHYAARQEPPAPADREGRTAPVSTLGAARAPVGSGRRRRRSA